MARACLGHSDDSHQHLARPTFLPLRSSVNDLNICSGSEVGTRRCELRRPGLPAGEATPSRQANTLQIQGLFGIIRSKVNAQLYQRWAISTD